MTYLLISFVVNRCSAFLTVSAVISHHCYICMAILISLISYFICLFVASSLMPFTTLDLTTFAISSPVASSATRFIASSLIYLFLVVALVMPSITTSTLTSVAIISAVVTLNV